MKAKLKHAAERTTPPGTKDMIRAYVDEEFSKRQKIYTRRVLLATCLALNDIAGFGDKRLLYILKGIEDITTDYAERVGKDYRASTAEEDKIAQMMQDELLSRRKIHVVLKSK